MKKTTTYKDLYKLHVQHISYCLKKSHLSHQYLKNIKQSGDDIEGEMRNLLTEILPNRFKVTHGYIVSIADADTEPDLSPQCDILIVDTLVPHRLFTIDEKNGMEIVPMEAVVGIIEVKRTLSTKTLKDAIEQIQKIKTISKIQKSNSSKFLPGGITIGDGIKGGYYSNPLIGILSVESIKNLDTKIKKILGIGPAELDIIGSFNDFLFVTIDNTSRAVMHHLRPEVKEIKYMISKEKTQERLVSKILGFIGAYVQETCGRKLDTRNYFFNTKI